MSGESRTRPERKTGFAHLFAAIVYSVGGLRRLLRESAFRLELAAGALALIVLLLLDASLVRVAGFVVLFLVLVAAEAFNTAIEVLVDHLSPEWAEFARDAKDLGSFAVGAVAVANAIYLVWAVLA